MTLLAFLLTSGVSMADLAAELAAPGETPQLRGLGVGTHFGRMPNWDIDKLLPLLKEMGVQYVRDEWGWGGVEKTKGVYAMYPYGQKSLDMLNSAGIKIIAVLDYGNTIYANPLDSDAFANYAGWMAKTYRGKVAAWEIWNEPDNFYFFRQYGGNRNGSNDAVWMVKHSELIRKAAAAIKKADPKANVLHNMEGEMWYYALKGHASDYSQTDGIDLHPYPLHLPTEGVEGTDATHNLIASFNDNSKVWPTQYLGHPVQCWIGENGFGTYEPIDPANAHFAPVSEPLQSAGELRTLIIGLIYGVKAWCIYDFVNETADPHDVESNMGLVRDYSHHYEPKPAFYGIQRLARLLGPGWRSQDHFKATLDARLSAPPNADHWLIANLPQMHWFRAGNKEVTIVWKAGKPDVDSPPDLGKIIWLGAPKGATAQAVDLVTGKNVDLKLKRESKGITLSEVPVGWAPLAIRWDLPAKNAPSP
jgi:hypothetical protein